MRTLLFLMLASGLCAQELPLYREYQGTVPESQYGWNVLPVCDLNGDGYNEIMICSPFFERDPGGTGYRGQAEIYLGGPSGGTDPILALHGPTVSGTFGISAACVGDYNADGLPDLVIGANAGGDSTEGVAYVYFGGWPLDTVPDLILRGEHGYDNFGFAVVGLGDYNQDGYDDFAISAIQSRIHGYRAGRVYIYYGGPAADDVPDLYLDPAPAGSDFGVPLIGGYDFNGDGQPDLAVGASEAGEYATSPGSAYVFFGGSQPDTLPAVHVRGRYPFGFFGTALTGLTDVNGDGFADLLVGAYNQPYPDSGAGAVYLYHGGDPMDSVPDWVLTGTVRDNMVGLNVADVGNLDSDPYSDFAIVSALTHPDSGNYSRIDFYMGSRGRPTRPAFGMTAPFEGDGFGSSITPVGDQNGDAGPDLAISSPGWNNEAEEQVGRVQVYLGGKLLVVAGNAVASPGEEATIPITLTQRFGFDVSQIHLVIGHRPEIAAVVRIDTLGTLLAGWDLTIIIQPDRIILDGNSPRPINAQGVLFNIVYRAAEDAVWASGTPLVLSDAQANGSFHIATRDGLLLIGGCVCTWTTDLIIREHRPVGADLEPYSLTFGMAEEATMSFDPGVDQLSLPAVEGRSWAEFPLTDSLAPWASSLRRDIRPARTTMTWLAAVPSDRAYRATWSPAALPGGMLRLNGLDMRADTAYEASPGETLRITLEVPALEVVSLTLHPGWNLLSMPVIPLPADDIGAIFDPRNGMPYTYDPARRGYLPLQAFSPGVGFWVLAPSETVLTFGGMRVGHYERNLLTGWNMVGATATETTWPLQVPHFLPPDVVDTLVWNFAGSYIPGTALLPGTGYWALALHPTQARVDESFGFRRPTVGQPVNPALTVDVLNRDGVMRLTAGLGLTARPSLPPPPDGRESACFITGSERMMQVPSTSSELWLDLPAGPSRFRVGGELAGRVRVEMAGGSVPLRDAELPVGRYRLLWDGSEPVPTNLGVRVFPNPARGPVTFRLRLGAAPDAAIGTSTDPLSRWNSLRAVVVNGLGAASTVPPSAERVQIQIFDLSGHLVASESATAGTGLWEWRWNPQGQPTGVYFWRVAASPGTAAGRCFIQ